MTGHGEGEADDDGIRAAMLCAGTTSMAIEVEVRMRLRPSVDFLKVTEAEFVFEAASDTGRKRRLHGPT
jgi:acyl-CoA hydrolase